MLQYWNDFLGFLKTNQIGDLSDLLTIIVVIAGFARAVFVISSSKRAAEAAEIASRNAETAARQAVDSIRLFESIVDFSQTISLLEEIKRAHRMGALEGLPDRYSLVRKTLISLKATDGMLTEPQQSVLRDAIIALKDLEKTVEKCLQSQTKISVPRINGLLADNLDGIIQVLAELKSAR